MEMKGGFWELNETDVLMLRKLESVRQHFELFDYEFRTLAAKFINSCSYEGKKIADRNEYEHLIKGDLSEYRKPIEYATEYNGQKVFGMSDWKGGFDEQFKPGELFSCEIAEYFLEVVPPKMWSRTYIQCGEPYSHQMDKDGNFKATYTTFKAVKGEISDTLSVWKYCGHCFKGEDKEFKGE